mgnify:CR=1 FL=1
MVESPDCVVSTISATRHARGLGAHVTGCYNGMIVENVCADVSSPNW